MGVSVCLLPRSLRAELQQQRDAVRIKEKQLDDHAHSLQQLRGAAAEGGRERAVVQREVEETRRRLEQEQENTEQLQVRSLYKWV